MYKWHLVIPIFLILFSTGCAVPTPTPLPPAATPLEESTPMNIPDPNLQTKDLSSFETAWNSRDIQSIKALYTSDARIFTETEARNLENQAAINVQVSDELIAGILQSIPEGMKMRILGQPVMVYDKLVAFAYRIENSTQGYNATGLLRYEGDKIYQHIFLLSGMLTSNTTPATVAPLEAAVGKMMSTWSKADLNAVSALYAKDAIILSDEDLAQVQWRDYNVPPSIEQLLNQFSTWKPELISLPVQQDDTAIFAWRWSIFSFPVGYGIRLVKIVDGLITIDVRYAIRPWEAQGKDFAPGG